MEIVARSNSLRISPRKIMLVAEILKNKSVEDALSRLMLIRKRGAKPLYKLLKSAVANAINNAKKNKDLLFIKSIYVTPGPMLKRFRPSTKGRVHPYKKRSSHIKIVLDSVSREAMKNPNIKIRNPKQIQITKIQNSK